MLPLPRFKLKGMLGFTEGPASNLGDEKKKSVYLHILLFLFLKGLKLLWSIKEHVWKLHRTIFPQFCLFSTTTNSFEPNKDFFIFHKLLYLFFQGENSVSEGHVWFVRCDVWIKKNQAQYNFSTEYFVIFNQAVWKYHFVN